MPPRGRPLPRPSGESLFLDRNLSWLAFNSSVLHEAEDERTPLLERVRFLGIFTSNLDEFFMKRVGGLKRQAASGMDASSQLDAIRRKTLPMLERQAKCYADHVRPALAAEGIHLAKWRDLNRRHRAIADEFYRRQVFPVLTPIAVDPGHPFPFVSNLSTSLGILLRRADAAEKPLFARVKIPGAIPQWVALERSPDDSTVLFLSLTELVASHLDALFPGLEIVGVMPFRVTRSSDIERDEEDVDDLLEMVTDELRERRFAPVVRLEHAATPDPDVLRFVMDELEVSDRDVYQLPAGLDATSLQVLLDLNRPSLKYQPWVPVTPSAFADREQDIFGAIRTTDVLVHHPYESFSASVERFIGSAVADPQVRAIKMTMYRTGDESPFIPLLVQAAEAGKQVACLVEIKARFDEARNIAVARSLERAGVHVIYGVVGYKTHCKLMLVVREEGSGLRGYVHVGTGNYNARTAQLYTDLGLFTANPEIVEDVINVFNFLTGRSVYHDYKRLLVAPVNMREQFLARIEREAVNASQGKPARIVAQMNQLEDPAVISALYRASSAGVSIDLVVRGFCTLRPGIPGLSENIRVISVIGRFLEHSRIYHFANGRTDPLDGEVFIGSADWMQRNLSGRVECIVPVLSRPLRSRCLEILSILLHDRRQAWELRADGSYTQRRVEDPGKDLGTHALLMSLARHRTMGAIEAVRPMEIPGLQQP